MVFREPGCEYMYRGADKSVARPGRNKLMFLSEWREFPSAPCLARKKLDDSSCLDVVEIVHGPDMLPRMFPSRSGSDVPQVVSHVVGEDLI